MESPAGWGLHLTVLGALAIVGVALTVFDYFGPSSGSWISLRGIGSALYWMCFAAFAAASTVTFALLRARLGVPLSYAAAVPLAGAAAAAIWFGWRAIDAPLARKAEASLARDLATRLTLESWSMAEEADGIVRFTVKVRADRDGSIEFDPSAGIGGYVAIDRATKSPERMLRAGESAVLEATAKRTTQGAFDSIDLFFISRLAIPDPQVKGGIAYRESGQIDYTTDTQDEALANGWLLKRPLPRPSTTTQ